MGLCIAKVLTVQVVIRNIYCSGGTSSNVPAVSTPYVLTSPRKHVSTLAWLCAKVHLVQIVK